MTETNILEAIELLPATCNNDFATMKLDTLLAEELNKTIDHVGSRNLTYTAVTGKRLRCWGVD